VNAFTPLLLRWSSNSQVWPRLCIISSDDRERERAARNKLVARLADLDEVLRGSLLRRTLRHSSGCPKCARGEGHPLWVLNVGYPGGKTRQLSLRPEQVPQIRQAVQRYHQVRETLEAISEINRSLLRLDRDQFKAQERAS
jgi:hypothetical protein